MADNQTLPPISNGAPSESASEERISECLSNEAFFNELHEKYIRNKHGEAAKKLAENAWTQESPALLRLIPKFKDELGSRYQIVKPLGVGGVGVVLQLFDTNLETPRALKFARPTSGRESFFAEVISGEISRLREAVHPNIIGIFQHGNVSSDGTLSPYYIMEFIPGAKDAAEYFTEQPHSLSDLLAVLAQAISGIAHLHKIGVLHGDIKLENILVAESGRAAISDLGSARRLEDGSDDTILIFTRHYAHPAAIALATAASGSDPNRVRASLPRKSLQMAFDLYALGKNLLRLLSIYESPNVPPLNPYIRKYLKLMACRLLDGTNTDQECALALPRVSFNEIKYKKIFEAEIDLRKLTGEYSLSEAVPELDSHTARTIQTSSLSPTPFTKRLARIISHPAMHRLAGVPQLGFISLVYPTATHSRLEHVLGTLTNVVRYCDALYHDASNPLFKQLMTAEDIKAVLLAGLFHDLGQYPLAHDLQDAAPEMFAHEEIAVGLLEERYEAGDAKGLANIVRSDWGIEPGRVAKIIKADPNDLSLPIKDRILHTLIDGPIDADKLDYLVRDSTNLNVPFGQAIDFQRLLQCLTIIYKEQERKLYVSLGIHEKGKVPAETVAFARYAMFGSVYWHHTSRAAKAMLHRAVWEGLPERTQRSNYRAYREDLIDFVLHTGRRTGKQGELYESKVGFSELSQLLPPDREMIEWIAGRTSMQGKELLKMLAARDLFRRILVISRPKSQRLWELLGKFRDRAGADGMITLQKEVQLRGVNFLKAANKQTMPYPDSSAVGGEAIDRLISAQEGGTVLILVDIPTERSGSKTSLEYLPEGRSKRHAAGMEATLDSRRLDRLEDPPRFVP